MTRLSTGLADLDLIMGGGLEQGSATVIAGPPGSGKTILAQQICFANATTEHKAVYYTTLSEPHSKLVEHLRVFPFFRPKALGSRVEYVHLGDMLRSTAADDLEPLIDEVVRRALDDEPALVVIDSTKVLRDFVSDHALRTALYDLTSRVAHSRTVLLLLGEYTPEEMCTGPEFTLCDAIVHLSYQAREPIDRRALRVVKMRATNHLGGAHTVQITPAGFRVYPRIEALLPGDVPSKDVRIPSGIDGLDALMGSGIPQADATLVLGPSGVGKTIGCLNFLAEGLARGERCAYITFQDTVDQLVDMAGTFGRDFETPRIDGRLVISHVPVGDLDLDVLASVVRHRLTDGATTRIVIDSLSEMAVAAREAVRFPAYLRSLLGIVRTAGASLWVTSETRTFGPMEEPFAGLMFLFQNVIQIRYIEHRAAIGRVLNVLKMRNSHHDNRLHACDITERGVAVGDAVDHVTGILGWSPLRHSPGSDPAR
ncbi:serine/threonine protein kinase [Actinoplanes lobatus]|uniref:non-specific serine/threonine protein kinase n=1 Tax=Actinoplanes lobatus TaxID=113568 RepID=A0A7W7MEY6_9ACTN|nr:ATPase domain-containing protein [Actinoplanes lobatus]MBB4747708.1 circadian clock protein KaiC [Actinoplanes lobatus]GGN73234.1 serine/threonine protein kinase [Actinoplanes lobatus]GIE39726.1 serine/threonine protein kinase [Actinoplanes lobatus]